jgi:ActR/RegA family two-component response regulator
LIKNEKFNIAIIDMILKNDIRGDALNRKIKEISPDIFSVVSTGYSDDDVMGDILKYGFNYKLPKPYKLKDIENFLKFYIEWSKK